MVLYTIRYRCTDGRGHTVLVVDDPSGAAHLFSDGRIQAPRVAYDGRAHLVEGLSCVPVPRVAPYTLDGLRRLLPALLAPHAVGTRDDPAA